MPEICPVTVSFNLVMQSAQVVKVVVVLYPFMLLLGRTYHVSVGHTGFSEA